MASITSRPPIVPIDDPDVVPEHRPPRHRRLTPGSVGAFVALLVGALIFLFPFWYMLVGALQLSPDASIAGAFPNPLDLTLDNLRAINAAVDLPQTLLSSSIFTGGVILTTLSLGLPAGYAFAQLDFRGRSVMFNVVLLLLTLPFMLLMIPLYIMIVRWYGLADSYLGMILPFAVNPTAVFLFRQFFKSIPASLFESARIDGGTEGRILLRVALPLARPAILTGVLVTFIGPWNEFLWPFLITKDSSKQPLAVALGSFIDNAAATEANPFGAILAGAVVLAVPAVLLFLLFQGKFSDTQFGSGVKG